VELIFLLCVRFSPGGRAPSPRCSVASAGWRDSFFFFGGLDAEGLCPPEIVKFTFLSFRAQRHVLLISSAVGDVLDILDEGFRDLLFASETLAGIQAPHRPKRDAGGSRDRRGDREGGGADGAEEAGGEEVDRREGGREKAEVNPDSLADYGDHTEHHGRFLAEKEEGEKINDLDDTTTQWSYSRIIAETEKLRETWRKSRTFNCLQQFRAELANPYLHPPATAQIASEAEFVSLCFFRQEELLSSACLLRVLTRLERLQSQFGLLSGGATPTDVVLEEKLCKSETGASREAPPDAGGLRCGRGESRLAEGGSTETPCLSEPARPRALVAAPGGSEEEERLEGEEETARFSDEVAEINDAHSALDRQETGETRNEASEQRRGKIRFGEEVRVRKYDKEDDRRLPPQRPLPSSFGAEVPPLGQCCMGLPGRRVGFWQASFASPSPPPRFASASCSFLSSLFVFGGVTFDSARASFDTAAAAQAPTGVDAGTASSRPRVETERRSSTSDTPPSRSSSNVSEHPKPPASALASPACGPKLAALEAVEKEQKLQRGDNESRGETEVTDSKRLNHESRRPSVSWTSSSSASSSSSSSASSSSSLSSMSFFENRGGSACGSGDPASPSGSSFPSSFLSVSSSLSSPSLSPSRSSSSAQSTLRTARPRSLSLPSGGALVSLGAEAPSLAASKRSEKATEEQFVTLNYLNDLWVFDMQEEIWKPAEETSLSPFSSSTSSSTSSSSSSSLSSSSPSSSSSSSSPFLVSFGQAASEIESENLAESRLPVDASNAVASPPSELPPVGSLSPSLHASPAAAVETTPSSQGDACGVGDEALGGKAKENNNEVEETEGTAGCGKARPPSRRDCTLSAVSLPGVDGSGRARICLLLYGGIGENNELLNDLWLFDLATRQWTSVSPQWITPPQFWFVSSAFLSPPGHAYHTACVPGLSEAAAQAVLRTSFTLPSSISPSPSSSSSLSSPSPSSPSPSSPSPSSPSPSSSSPLRFAGGGDSDGADAERSRREQRALAWSLHFSEPAGAALAAQKAAAITAATIHLGRHSDMSSSFSSFSVSALSPTSVSVDGSGASEQDSLPTCETSNWKKPFLQSELVFPEPGEDRGPSSFSPSVAPSFASFASGNRERSSSFEEAAMAAASLVGRVVLIFGGLVPTSPSAASSLSRTDFASDSTRPAEGPRQQSSLPPRSTDLFLSRRASLGCGGQKSGGDSEAVSSSSDVFASSAEPDRGSESTRASAAAPSPRRGDSSLSSTVWERLRVDTRESTKTEVTDALFEYYVDSNVWVRCEASGEKPSARMRHSATLLGSYMFVYGGRGADGELCSLTTIFRLHIPSKSWTALALGGVRLPRLELAAGLTLNNCLYVFGGHDGQERVSNGLVAAQLGPNVAPRHKQAGKKKMKKKQSEQRGSSGAGGVFSVFFSRGS
ncbi:kelch repeat-containing protein, partial [Toxoplasma gondii p89]